jgi:hypothetical protein
MINKVLLWNKEFWSTEEPDYSYTPELQLTEPEELEKDKEKPLEDVLSEKISELYSFQLFKLVKNQLPVWPTFPTQED